MTNPLQAYVYILFGAGAVTLGGWQMLVVLTAAIAAVDLFYWTRSKGYWSHGRG